MRELHVEVTPEREAVLVLLRAGVLGREDLLAFSRLLAGGQARSAFVQAETALERVAALARGEGREAEAAQRVWPIMAFVVAWASGREEEAGLLAHRVARESLPVA